MFYKGCEIIKCDKYHYAPVGLPFKTKTLKFSKEIIDHILAGSSDEIAQNCPCASYRINEGRVEHNLLHPKWAPSPGPHLDGKGMTFFERLDYDRELLKRSRPA